MSKKQVLMKVGGVPVYWDGTVITFTGEMTVCADGSASSLRAERLPSRASRLS